MFYNAAAELSSSFKLKKTERRLHEQAVLIKTQVKKNVQNPSILGFSLHARRTKK